MSDKKSHTFRISKKDWETITEVAEQDGRTRTGQLLWLFKQRAAEQAKKR